MIQAMIEIPEEANHMLNIIKARYKLKTKSEAISKIVLEFSTNLLEPELLPEYIKKLKNIEKKGDFISFNSIKELKKSIENA